MRFLPEQPPDNPPSKPDGASVDGPRGASEPLLCSECFADQGLKLAAAQIGVQSSAACPHCGSAGGAKLDKWLIRDLAVRFFVQGTLQRADYGAAPIIQCNDGRAGGELELPMPLQADADLIERSAGVGLFLYGPRDWMLGGVEPLVELQDPARRDPVVERILREYPVRLVNENDIFYRLRRNPRAPAEHGEYDSPPPSARVEGYRLDCPTLPVLYASQDVEVCIHECRVTVEDDLFLATLQPKKALRLLDLSETLEETVTEFESLDMAVHMLFMAGKHAYPITRAIAERAKEHGFDGVIYPSYFSMVRLGVTPFDTNYGLSLRHHVDGYGKAETIERQGAENQRHHPRRQDAALSSLKA
jgi:hypothetical protein